MKKRVVPFVGFIMTLALAVGLGFVLPVAASAAPTAGIEFTAVDTYTMESALDAVPMTVAAWVNIPAGTNTDSIIVGNYINNTDKSVQFAINAKGQPRVSYVTTNSKGAVKTPVLNFTEADVRTGEWTHVAFTLNAASNTFTCYVNGEALPTSMSATWIYSANEFVRPLMLGGSYAAGNSTYFKGALGGVTMYEAELTAEQIGLLYSDGISAVTESPIAHYALEGAAAGENITDSTANGNDFIYAVPSDAPESGLTFTADDKYTAESAVAAVPSTVSAWVKIPESYKKTGNIISNYTDTTTKCISFSVTNNGYPQIYFITTNSSGTLKTPTLTFSEADVRTDEWTNITFVMNAAEKYFTCYINGAALPTTQSSTWIYTANEFANPLMLGGSNKTDNPDYFGGTIGEVVMYESEFTADQVALLCAYGAGAISETPIALYELEGAEAGSDIADTSGGGNNMIYSTDAESYVTVSFDANGGEGTMADVTDAVLGVEYTLPDCAFTAPEGKYFAGWSLARDGEIITGTSITPETDITLYAVWADIVLPSDGLTFTTEPYYMLENTLSDVAYTYSAWVYVPKGLEGDSAGAILSSWPNNTDPSVNFYINTNGQPGFTYRVGEGSTNNTYGYFTEGSFPYGEWVHIAVTVDSENKKTVKCYINGVADSKTVTLKNEFDENSTALPFVLGGNAFPGNSAVFKGAIKEVALYKETLTADQIALLYNAGVDGLGAVSPLAHYDTANVTDGADISDISGNGNHIAYVNRWFSQKEAVTGYAYSFAVVGDIQSVTYYAPEELETIYSWIADNVDSKNIKYVFNLGDIVETVAGLDSEWTAAKNAIDLLNGVVPYSLLRGNHDNSAKFNEYFANDTYMSQLEGFYEEGKIDNFYDIITAGDDEYLHIGLDYGPSDEVLAWAGSIVEQYPELKVIVTTHAMVGENGEWFVDSAGDGALNGGGLNNGQNIWDEFVKKYENIELVLCGHDPSDDIVVKQVQGDNGNTVTAMLIDPQYIDKYWGAAGLVAMFYVYPETGNVEIEYYSPIREKYFKESNQFEAAVWSVPSEDVGAAVKIGYAGLPESVSAGESFTADIVISAADSAQSLSSFNLSVDYDTAKLKLVSITVSDSMGGEAIVNGAAIAWHNASGAALAVDTTGVAVARATFEVVSTLANSTSATLGFDETATLNVTLENDDIKTGFTPDTEDSAVIELEVIAFEYFFIYDDEYMALEEGTKIFCIKADTNDCTYSLDGKKLVYSDKYKAHLVIIADDASTADEEMLASAVTVASGAADTVDYSGDVNGDGTVTAGDAALISSLLHAYATGKTMEGIDDMMRLRADFHTTGSAYVTVSDCSAVLHKTVGLDYSGENQ